MKVTVVAGNPKPDSRTLAAGRLLVERLTGSPADEIVDVVRLGPGLLGWGDSAVADAVATVRSSDLLIVASPTFKATYTGILKLFLDQLPTGDGLEGVVAVPLMLGAGPAHAMAPEMHLKPVLVEVGATVPSPGFYLLEKTYEDESSTAAFIDRWGSIILAATTARHP